MDFPNSPTNGQTIQLGDTTYIYSSLKQRWEANSNTPTSVYFAEEFALRAEAAAKDFESTQIDYYIRSVLASLNPVFLQSYQGIYNNTGSYNKGDIIYYNNLFYICRQDNLIGFTPSQGFNWHELSADFAIVKNLIANKFEAEQGISQNKLMTPERVMQAILSVEGTILFPNRTVAFSSGISPDINLILIGGLSYYRDTSVNTNDGNAAYVHSDGSRWSPAYQISIKHWGENTIPGVTNMRVPITKLISWIRNNQIHNILEEENPTTIDGFGELYAISAPIYTAGLKGVEFTNTRFVAIPGASWTSGNGTNRGNSIFVINGGSDLGLGIFDNFSKSISFNKCSFDGAKIAAGLVTIEQNTLNCSVLNCIGTKFREFATISYFGAISTRIVDNLFYGYHESSEDFLEYTLWPETCIEVRSSRSIVDRNRVFTAKRPIIIKSFSNIITNNQIYLKTPTVFLDEISNYPNAFDLAQNGMYIFSSDSNTISNNIFFDCVCVILHKSVGLAGPGGTNTRSFVFANNIFRKDSGAFNNGVIRFATIWPDSDLEGVIFIGNVIENVNGNALEKYTINTGSWVSTKHLRGTFFGNISTNFDQPLLGMEDNNYYLHAKNETVNLKNIPTTPSGLLIGDLWRDGDILKIVV